MPDFDSATIAFRLAQDQALELAEQHRHAIHAVADFLLLMGRVTAADVRMIMRQVADSIARFHCARGR
jgi:hypothetical protein